MVMTTVDGSGAVLNKRHGFHLTCQTCNGAKTIVGGIESPKQFVKIIREHRRQHRNHVYKLEQSYHAAELAHATQTETTERTTTSTTYSDFTNNSIPATSFQANKKYLLVVSAVLRSSVNTTAARMQVVRGTTVFADSVQAVLPVVSTDRVTYCWWTVFTQPATAELVKAQISNSTSGNTTGVDHFKITAIKLSDDLTENTDWMFAENATSTSLTTAGVNGASTGSFTPAVANDSWLVLTRSRNVVNSTTRSFGSRIVRSGEASSTGPFQQREGRSTTLEAFVQTSMRVFSLGAAANTFTEQSFSVVANTGSRSHSGVFCLNLNKLAARASAYADASILTLSSTDFATTVANISITPTVTGDVWTWGMFVLDYNSASWNGKMRLQINNTTNITSDVTADNYFCNTAPDAIDELAFHMQGIESLAASTAYSIDMDGSIADPPPTNSGARGRSLFAVTMELLAPPLVTAVPSTDQVGITEATTSALTLRETPTTDQVGITEAISVAMSVWFAPTTDTVGITEATASTLIYRVTPATDQVGITETVHTDVVSLAGAVTAVPTTDTVGITESIATSLQYRHTVTTDTVGITEAIATAMSIWFAPTTDQIGITETVHSVVETITQNLTAVIADSLNIAETTNSRLQMRMAPTTEQVAITESVHSSLTQPIQVIPTTDVVGITETVHAELGIYHLISGAMLQLRFSGGASNTNPANSIGGAKSTTAQGIIQNTLFPNVTKSESLTQVGGTLSYRCIYVHNAHSTMTMYDTRIWIEQNTEAGDHIRIGVGFTGTNEIEPAIANQYTEPTGVVFSDAPDIDDPIWLGDLSNNGGHRAIWIERYVPPNTSAKEGNSYTLRGAFYSDHD